MKTIFDAIDELDNINACFNAVQELLIGDGCLLKRDNLSMLLKFLTDKQEEVSKKLAELASA